MADGCGRAMLYALNPWNGPKRACARGAAASANPSAIVELLTRGHGRPFGPGARRRRLAIQPLLQPGNGVRAVWRARLDEHLGTYVIEGARLRAANLLASSHAVYGVTHLASLARLLPERDPIIRLRPAGR